MANSSSPRSTAASARSTSQAATDAAERWRKAGRHVRICAHPDEPRLIERYLALGTELHLQHGLPLWNIALESAWLLHGTAADRALPMHWRTLCVDYIHRPLSVLDSLADTETRAHQRAQFRWQLALLDMDPVHSLHPGSGFAPEPAHSATH